jgi:hypothetical protein
MIIDIALGIVLAVVIIYSLPVVIGIGFAVGALALGVAIVGAIIAFIVMEPTAAAIIASVLAALAAIVAFADWLSRRTVIGTDGWLLLFLLLGIIALTVWVGALEYSEGKEVPFDPLLLTIFGGLLILGVLLGVRSSIRRVRVEREKLAATKSYTVAQEERA